MPINARDRFNAMPEERKARVRASAARMAEIHRESLKALTDDDLCGLCGEPGADKIPHPIYWPGERRPETELVHQECEQEETARAHGELSQVERDRFIDDCIRHG